MVQIYKSFIVAKYTFRELIKSRILWNVVGLGGIISILTFVATEFTFGVPQRVALDLGLGALSISSYGIALLIGIGLIKKEVESRTIYLIISRPVSRVAFLAGKITGVSLFLVLNLSFLALLTIGIVIFLGGTITPITLFAMLFTILEAILLLMVVVFLSLVTNSAIALMGAVLALVAGHAISETTKIVFVTSQPWLKNIVEVLNYLIPAFHRFNLKDYVLYQNTIEINQLMFVLAYWIFYVGGLFCFASIIINKKNMD